MLANHVLGDSFIGQSTCLRIFYWPIKLGFFIGQSTVSAGKSQKPPPTVRGPRRSLIETTKHHLYRNRRCCSSQPGGMAWRRDHVLYYPRTWRHTGVKQPAILKKQYDYFLFSLFATKKVPKGVLARTEISSLLLVAGAASFPKSRTVPESDLQAESAQHNHSKARQQRMVTIRELHPKGRPFCKPCSITPLPPALETSSAASAPAEVISPTASHFHAAGGESSPQTKQKTQNPSRKAKICVHDR